jgi:hypothetical protein
MDQDGALRQTMLAWGTLHVCIECRHPGCTEEQKRKAERIE